MLRKLILIFLGLTGLTLAAILLVNRQTRGVTQIEVQTSVHYFVARTPDDVESIHCSFSNTLERITMSALWREPLQPCNLGSGWSHPARSGVRSMARNPRFDIRLPSADWSVLLMTVKAFENAQADQPQTMTVRLNGQALDTIEVPEAWTTVQLRIPDGFLREGINRFSSTFGYRVSPSGARKNKDRRLYSIHLRDVFVARAPRGALTKRQIDRIVKRQSTRDTARNARFDRRSSHFAVSHPGTLVLPMTVPADAERIESHVDSKGGQGGVPDVRLSIRSLSSDAAHGPVTPVYNGGDRHSPMMLGADVSRFAGDTCLVMIDVAQRSDQEIVIVSSPRFIRRSASPLSVTTSGHRGPSPPALPDIVMITLDAARGDRFSCYGYHRQTTPNIDRLATESMVFRNVFALAPFTLCSVPTMVTGLSFLDHQVTTHGQRLSDRATTLAEYLKRAGYQTACFSASPNNSRAIGTDQGYDDFVESWKVVPRPASTDPFLLSRMALNWLAEYNGTAPLHLQLHYVPPHAPYNPLPEFDIFTDPGYRGRYDGNHRTIGALDSGLWVPRPEDLAHVIALYDGNLREGDAAVAQVLEALRQRPRWRNTVVLVTSDHGEAFLEHGKMSHNSTVFDEMLHVPFVLRLPEEMQAPPAVDLDGLATLADIVPTLLAFAGVRAEPEIAGVDLLAPAREESSSRGRFLVARTTGDPPLYALRTLRWKLILSASGQGALFNLERDPEERRDLALRARSSFAGLGLLLTERLERGPFFESMEEINELPDEDAEMLKALGYLQ